MNSLKGKNSRIWENTPTVSWFIFHGTGVNQDVDERKGINDKPTLTGSYFAYDDLTSVEK
ncbi:MAG: hypothetical protein AAFR59_01895 [Bacteroidota bacterium]